MSCACYVSLSGSRYQYITSRIVDIASVAEVTGIVFVKLPFFPNLSFDPII